MSMLCSEAILRTNGLDLVRRNSAAPVPSAGPSVAGAAFSFATSPFLTKGLTSVLCTTGAGSEAITGLGRSIVGDDSGFGDSGGAAATSGLAVLVGAAAA